MTSSPLFGLDNVIVTPHLGASTREAQDKAGEAVADMVQLALNGEFVPFAVNIAASETNKTLRPFVPLAERLGRVFASLVGGIPTEIEAHQWRNWRLRFADCHVECSQGLSFGVIG